jgi:very-short-patch-repair endonuclease
MSQAEDTLEWQLKVSGFHGYVREFRFHKTRRWRWDFAFVKERIAIEINGGIASAKSGHRSMTGVLRDYEKINASMLEIPPWRVLQVTPAQVKSGEALNLIELMLKRKP